MQIKKSKEKSWFKLWFFPSYLVLLWGFNKKDCYVKYLFTSKEAEIGRWFRYSPHKNYPSLWLFPFPLYHGLKDTLKAFDDFQNNQKSVWSNAFWYIKVCIFWKCIQWAKYWDKTQLLKKSSSGKLGGTKIALRAATHQFYFQFAILQCVKAQGSSLKSCGIFHFRFRFVFIKVCIFIEQNAWTLSL